MKRAVCAAALLAALVVGAARAGVTGVYAAQNATYGKILISSTGRTLYHAAGSCTGTCAATWKPLAIAAGAKPVAGPGVSAALLGSVKRPDGTLQVTYAGKTLYLYSGDKKAGDVRGVGRGWNVIVVAAPAHTTTTPPPAASSGGSGAGSSGAGGGASPGGTSTTSADCAANPGGYGCM